MIRQTVASAVLVSALALSAPSRAQLVETSAQPSTDLNANWSATAGRPPDRATPSSSSRRVARGSAHVLEGSVTSGATWGSTSVFNYGLEGNHDDRRLVSISPFRTPHPGDHRRHRVRLPDAAGRIPLRQPRQQRRRDVRPGRTGRLRRRLPRQPAPHAGRRERTFPCSSPSPIPRASCSARSSAPERST